MLDWVTKPLFFFLAWLSLVLGFIGAFLPVLPTTPFLILSAYLFSKSSPKMHSWLTSLPHFGSAILEWEKHKVIRPRAKIMAIGMLWLMLGSTIIFAQLAVGLKIMLGCIGLSVTLFIATRKSHVQTFMDSHITD
jgi:uncharacterized protein